MASLKFKGLLVTTDDQIHQIDIEFNPNINQPLIQLTTKMDSSVIIENMKVKYNCHGIASNVARGLYPDNSFCHAFYAGSTEASGHFNKIATHIVNTTYNNCPRPNKVKCYGNCYIILVDENYGLHDIGADTFVHLFNKVYSSTGFEERDYNNRLFKSTKSPKCYLHHTNHI